MGVGECMKKIRLEKGLKQKDISRDLEVSQSYISGVENGKETPTRRFVKLFCLQYGVSDDKLMVENESSQIVGGEDMVEKMKVWLFDLAHGNLEGDAIIKGFIKFYILQGKAICNVQDDIHFHTFYGDDNCKRAMEDLRDALESYVS